MKWVLIIVGVLAVIVIVTLIVGSLLPERHTARVVASYRQPPEVLWPTITDFAAWPSWNPGVKKMERQADRDGKPVWLLADENGEMPTRVEELTAPEAERPGRIVTRIDDPSLPFGGTWTWEIDRTKEGTQITITEDGVIRNPVFRVMSKLFFDPHGTAKKYLTALGKKHGADVSPAAAP